MEKENQKTYKDYLDKTFLEELNYKIWSTKGGRFNASKRLKRIDNLSKLCTSLLSVYLIAVSLISVYNIYVQGFNENLLAYSITCLSILILIFGQIENAKDFSSKSREYHNCGLELSKLYNELRIFKTLKSNPSLNERRYFATKISDKYQRILERHENHSPIDHEMFKASKPSYHELSFWDIKRIKVNYYFNTEFVYHFLIFTPFVFIIFILFR